MWIKHQNLLLDISEIFLSLVNKQRKFGKNEKQRKV
jgi:hypothetical protein